MNKTVISVVVVVVLIIGVSIMRKDSPLRIEIVPSDKALWIVNADPKAPKDCSINVEGPKLSKRYTLPSGSGSLQIGELSNDETYTLKIKRADVIGQIKYRPLRLQARPSAQVRRYVVLVGASVGKSWELRGLADRIKDKSVFYGFRELYTFDKTQAIDALIRQVPKPDAVIIKECSAYFPRDVEPSIQLVKEWVKSLESAGIRPFLATVVPVTEKNDSQNRRGESINRFNQGLRAMAREKGIPVLDLQAALSKNSQTGHLDESYAREDGLHLLPDAYTKKLDLLLSNLVNKVVYTR